MFANILVKTLPKMKEVKKTRSQVKREAIIEAAKSAFMDLGVDATSMDKVAEIAQVSKRTVYNHFASKEALVITLLTDLWNQAMLQPGINFDPNRSVEEQLVHLLMEEVNLVGGKEYIELARVAVGHYLFQPEAIQNEAAKFSAEKTALYRWLSEAKREEVLAITDVERAFSQLHSLVKGECFWPQLVQSSPYLNSEQKAQLVQETVEMFLSRYRQ